MSKGEEGGEIHYRFSHLEIRTFKSLGKCRAQTSRWGVGSSRRDRDMRFTLKGDLRVHHRSVKEEGHFRSK